MENGIKDIQIVGEFNAASSMAMNQLRILGENRLENIDYNLYYPQFELSTIEHTGLTVLNARLEDSKLSESLTVSISQMEVDEIKMSKLSQLRLSISDHQYWRDLDLIGPNQWVIFNSQQLIRELDSLPHVNCSIRPCADDGITFTFKRDQFALYLEIYNSKEIGYIIENRSEKRVVDNRDLLSVVEAVKVINTFVWG